MTYDCVCEKKENVNLKERYEGFFLVNVSSKFEVGF